VNIPAEYLEKIRAVYPSISLDRLEFNQEGMVNDIIIVDRQLVCRFPKTEWAQEVLTHEEIVLNLLQDRVELQVPRFEHFEEDFASYRLIRGEPLSRTTLLKLSDREQEQVFAQLGNFLKQLHNLPEQMLTKAGVLSSGAARTKEIWVEFYDRIENTIFPHLMRHQKTWVREHFNPVLQNKLDLNYQPVLTHGDLGVYHILFDSDSKTINGIIDFGTAGLGDPATDLAALMGNYGEEFLRYMEKSYPTLQNIVDRARFWMGTVELQWALAGVHHKDTGLLLAHIGGARPVKPIGAPI
jgi:aminoglycoside phosphotransferase (APT) family kinase protein